LPGRAVGSGEIVRGVYKTDVGEGLWEVPDKALRDDIVFLRQQAQVVAKAKQAVEERACILLPP
jgi:hypothetical protein